MPVHVVSAGTKVRPSQKSLGMAAFTLNGLQLPPASASMER
jgi:hypothetical protein